MISHTTTILWLIVWFYIHGLLVISCTVQCPLFWDWLSWFWFLFRRPRGFEVRGSAWVVSKKVHGTPSLEHGAGTWACDRELMMMTSATLIEALYEAVDDYLRDLGKSNITELSSKDSCVNVTVNGRLFSQKLISLQLCPIYIYKKDVWGLRGVLLKFSSRKGEWKRPVMLS